MTQIEYDNEMKRLSDVYAEATAPTRDQLNAVQAEMSSIKAEILNLRAKFANKQQEHQILCEKIRQAKQDFNEQKHAVYMNRPSRTESHD